MGEFSLPHILIILVIVLLLFGPSRLPGLGASLGKAIRGFKQGLNDLDGDTKPAAQSRPEQIESSASTSTADATKTKDPHHQS